MCTGWVSRTCKQHWGDAQLRAPLLTRSLCTAAACGSCCLAWLFLSACVGTGRSEGRIRCRHLVCCACKQPSHTHASSLSHSALAVLSVADLLAHLPSFLPSFLVPVLLLCVAQGSWSCGSDGSLPGQDAQEGRTRGSDRQGQRTHNSSRQCSQRQHMQRTGAARRHQESSYDRLRVMLFQCCSQT